MKNLKLFAVVSMIACLCAYNNGVLCSEYEYTYNNGVYDFPQIPDDDYSYFKDAIETVKQSIEECLYENAKLTKQQYDEFLKKLGDMYSNLLKYEPSDRTSELQKDITIYKQVLNLMYYNNISYYKALKVSQNHWNS